MKYFQQVVDGTGTSTKNEAPCLSRFLQKEGSHEEERRPHHRQSRPGSPGHIHHPFRRPGRRGHGLRDELQPAARKPNAGSKLGNRSGPPGRAGPGVTGGSDQPHRPPDHPGRAGRPGPGYGRGSPGRGSPGHDHGHGHGQGRQGPGWSGRPTRGLD